MISFDSLGGNVERAFKKFALMTSFEHIMIGGFWDEAAFSCAISPISSLGGYGSKKTEIFSLQ